MYIDNAYPRNTPKYCIDDVIDFLDNLYDVVFMTYEANITAYGIPLSRACYVTCGADGVVPHDIDWVKDRVRWYWEHKLAKSRKSNDPPPIAEPEKKEDHIGTVIGAAIVAATNKEIPIAA